MKQLFIILLLSIITFNIGAQTVKKEYYDPYYKTKIMAQYQVNSVGEKDGWFKGYDRQGVLVYEYNYKDNLFSGLNKEYVTYSGSRTLAQSETYKEGGLSGPAIYYAKGNRVMSKGSYLNNEKQGKWSYENPFDSYGYNEADKKGAKFLRFDKYYENGKEVFPDGGMKIYYSPSGKVHTDGYYLNGKESGDWTWYNPDGTIKAKKHYATPEEIKVMEENAKIEEEKARIKRQIKKEEREQAITLANNTLDSNKVEKAIELYEKLGIDTRYLNLFLVLKKKYENGEIDLGTTSLTYGGTFNDETNVYSMGSQLIRSGNKFTMKVHEDYCLKYIENKELEILAIEKINKEVQASFDLYFNENVKLVKTTSLDAATGKIIMHKTYLKNRIIYTKSMIVLEAYIEAFNTAVSVAMKQELGKKVIDSINTLNQIPESDWKDLKKQLKKIDDPEEIKSILKI